MVRLIQGDCLEKMGEIADGSVDLILTDPPYFRVKDEPWDRQWDTKDGFLSWLGDVLREFRRVLKPNGSLYLFASPQMAARVEVKTGEFFNVLNHIVWPKADTPTRVLIYGTDRFRTFVDKSERIIFAEQYGADSMALGESGYAAQCEELRGFVFEPIRAYLAAERDRAGLTNPEINVAWCEWKNVSSTSQTQKWFSSSCFNPPTAEAYEWLRCLFNANGGQHLRREYEDLRREYEDLRREYEDLRRPFAVSADVPYTDVWDFDTVGAYEGKHVCEKPQALLRHAITVSSRPGAVVLDAFMGKGSCGLACQELGRGFIGIEKEARYFNAARKRIHDASLQQRMTFEEAA